jgi:hypothetical protein
MEMVIGFLVLGLIVWSIYKMFSEENASIEETNESKEEVVVAKVEEVKPAPVASLEPVVTPVVDDVREEVKANNDTKIEEAFVKAMAEEATKLDKECEEVIKEVVATVEPVVEEAIEKTVAVVEEVIETVKRGRKPKAK